MAARRWPRTSRSGPQCSGADAHFRAEGAAESDVSREVRTPRPCPRPTPGWLHGWLAGSCVGGTQNEVERHPGRSVSPATCTINNNDIAPKLHLRKVVVNDNGGTKTVSDFTLTANGTRDPTTSQVRAPLTLAPACRPTPGHCPKQTCTATLPAPWVCAGGTQNGSNITVGIGGEATCTITNDDQPGTIVVIKNAKPAQGSFAFATTGTGYTGFTLTGATTNNGNRNSQTLNAGTYTVKESTQLAWILTGSAVPPSRICTIALSAAAAAARVPGDLNTQTATISLKNGDTVTWAFENTGSGVTRTQGFWATHPQLAQIAWFGGTAYGHTFPGVVGTAGIGDTTLCGRPIDSVAKLMGGFWSDISKKTTGAKRSSLDQARMQLLQQMLAAELNASAFGSVPSSGTFLAVGSRLLRYEHQRHQQGPAAVRILQHRRRQRPVHPRHLRRQQGCQVDRQQAVVGCPAVTRQRIGQVLKERGGHGSAVPSLF